MWQAWDVASASNHITVAEPLCVPYLNMVGCNASLISMIWIYHSHFARESRADVLQLAGLAGPSGAHLVFELLCDNGRAHYRDTDVSWLGMMGLIRREIADSRLIKLQACVPGVPACRSCMPGCGPRGVHCARAVPAAHDWRIPGAHAARGVCVPCRSAADRPSSSTTARPL